MKNLRLYCHVENSSITHYPKDIRILIEYNNVRHEISLYKNSLILSAIHRIFNCLIEVGSDTMHSWLLSYNSEPTPYVLRYRNGKFHVVNNEFRYTRYLIDWHNTN